MTQKCVLPVRVQMRNVLILRYLIGQYYLQNLHTLFQSAAPSRLDGMKARKRYTSAINRLGPISGSVRNVKGYFLLLNISKAIRSCSIRIKLNPS